MAKVYMQIAGVPKNYPTMPFGRQLDYRNQVADFQATARKTYLDSKGRSVAAAIKEFLRSTPKPTEWYAVDNTRPGWKDDSVQIFYKTAERNPGQSIQARLRRMGATNYEAELLSEIIALEVLPRGLTTSDLKTRLADFRQERGMIDARTRELKMLRERGPGFRHENPVAYGTGEFFVESVTDGRSHGSYNTITEARKVAKMASYSEPIRINAKGTSRIERWTMGSQTSKPGLTGYKRNGGSVATSSNPDFDPWVLYQPSTGQLYRAHGDYGALYEFPTAQQGKAVADIINRQKGYSGITKLQVKRRSVAMKAKRTKRNPSGSGQYYIDHDPDPHTLAVAKRRAKSYAKETGRVVYIWKDGMPVGKSDGGKPVTMSKRNAASILLRRANPAGEYDEYVNASGQRLRGIPKTWPNHKVWSEGKALAKRRGTAVYVRGPMRPNMTLIALGPASKSNPARRRNGDTEVRELELYADNTSELNRQRESILKNLATKVAQGKYKSGPAQKLWRYWVDAAAQRYNKEFGGGGGTSFGPFSVADRNAVAAIFRDHYEPELLRGDYLYYAPKKYGGAARAVNPKGGKRNPKSTFKSVAIGSVFNFDHSGLPLSSGIARGPWIKLSARTYKHVDGGPTHRVGSINARVVESGSNGRAKNPPRRQLKDDAAVILRDLGLNTTVDYHTLPSSKVDEILAVARQYKYTKSKGAPGSKARMFLEYLQRTARGRSKRNPDWKPGYEVLTEGGMLIRFTPTITAARAEAKRYSMMGSRAIIFKNGNERVETWEHGAKLKKSKRNPARKLSKSNRKGTVHRRDRYVVEVGGVPAWVGRLKSDADRAWRKLDAAGHKSVNIIKAKVTKVIKDGWRKAYKSAARKVGASKNPAGGVSYFAKAANEKSVYSLGGVALNRAIADATALAKRKDADVTLYRAKWKADGSVGRKTRVRTIRLV